MINTIHVEEGRAYRKNLSICGLIYLGFDEYPIRVINLSLSGFLAELSDKHPEQRLNDIFQSLRVSPVVDFYLPDMRVAGQAGVVRVDSIDGGLLIGVEFGCLSYNIDNLLYKRHAYRKSMATHGVLIIDAVEYEFVTENVSVDGLMVRIASDMDVELTRQIVFTFKQLELQGVAEVMWLERDEHSTLLGLKYVHLERDSIPGVPGIVADTKALNP